MRYEKIVPTENYPYKIFVFSTKNPDRLIPSHWHESGELLYCLSGELEVNFPNQQFLLRKGECLFINSNMVHSSRSPVPGTCLAIQLPFYYLQEVTEGLYGKEYLFNLVPSNTDANLVKILQLIIDNLYYNDIEKHLFIKSKIFEILSVLWELYIIPTAKIQDVKSFKYLDRLKIINEYIQQHVQQDLSINEVAATFNYHPAYFSRFYKKYMGITFSSYVTSLRLEAAYKLLRDTDLTILEIGLASGFSTIKSFYNSFKKNYGVSPQYYRKQYFKKGH